MRLVLQKMCFLVATAFFALADLHTADAGSVLFDNFTTGTILLSTSVDGTTLTDSVDHPLGSVLSPNLGSRLLAMTKSTGDLNVSAYIDSGVDKEVNFAAAGLATYGQFHVDYIFYAGKSLNLTNATKITLGGNSDPAAIGTTLGVQLIDTLDNVFTQIFSLTNPSNLGNPIPFSHDFLLSGFTGINLSNLNFKFISFGTYGIDMMGNGMLVNATPDADIRITNFSYTIVPEPSSFVLFALMTISVLWYRRRKTELLPDVVLRAI